MKIRTLLLSAAFLTVILMSSGCSVSSDNESGSATIEWGTCPDYINKAGNAECAFVKVPRDYERPWEGAVDLFIWRIRGTLPDSQKKGNVWFIQGGPGDSSIAFADFLPPVAASHPEWDYYSMDHRGVGNSNCLECRTAAPDGHITPANAASCYGEVQAFLGGGLGLYNVTNASRDLKTVIDLTSGSGKVFVYGVSYGTYLVQRFMTLFSDSVDGIIIDSIVPSDSRPLDNYDSEFNYEGMQIMEQCSHDAVCSEKMATVAADPWDAAGVVFDRIDHASLCSDFSSITRKKLRQKLAELASITYGRALIPALIYRLNRCGESDKAVIEHLFGNSAEARAASEEFRPVDDLFSSVIFENIAISELYNGISPWAAQEIADVAYVSEDLVPDLAGAGHERLWPSYSDPYTGVKPLYMKPVLMMNSTVDGHTPLSLAINAAQYLNRSYQYFITVPWAAHGVAFQSPVKGSLTPINERVGMGILFDFISNPYAEPDTSRLADCYILEFSGTSVENRFISGLFFGTDDMWE
jgi:pimeloyl-ACP methyl ester carboxylesterase